VQSPLILVSIATIALLTVTACTRKEASPITTATNDCPFRSDQGKAGPGTVQLLSTLSKMNLVNPIADLDANLAIGDRRFIGINGYSCSEPGVANGDQEVVNRFHSRCLEGTGDVIEGNLDWALTDAATAYATKYNTELLRRIRAGTVT
jgi:hypothetical protein